MNHQEEIAMQKIVINACFGGFGLSKKALALYNKRSGSAHDYTGDILRDCPHLVRLVEEMGEKAGSSHSRLRIVEIPDDVEWQIEEYDGSEWVAEKHRTWR
jgi:hypothetical protein